MTVNDLIENFRINVEDGGVFITDSNGYSCSLTKNMLEYIRTDEILGNKCLHRKFTDKHQAIFKFIIIFTNTLTNYTHIYIMCIVFIKNNQRGEVEMKSKFIKKLCAVALSALMLAGAGAIGSVPFIDTSLTVSAETTNGEFRYEVNAEGGITITGYKGSDTLVTIPDTIDGRRVTSIGEYAFCDCESLTSVTIPDSVTSIGYRAFEDCTSLTSVTIPDSVTSIGNEAFYNCKSLTSVTIPDSVTSIGYSAFSGTPFYENDTRELVIYGKVLYKYIGTQTKVIIPNSVTSIGDYAFCGCYSLTSVTIPDSVTSIGYSAFERCTSLTSVTIPDSVTSIGEDAFRVCESLTSVTIPDSVTSIGKFAFYGCKSLTSATIPDSVTSIGYGAFGRCTSLTSVTIPDSVTYIGNVAFKDCTSLTSVTIPDSVTSIGKDAFAGCDNIAEVIYYGTEESFNAIQMHYETKKKLYSVVKYEKKPEPTFDPVSLLSTSPESSTVSQTQESAAQPAETVQNSSAGNSDNTAMSVLITVIIILLVVIIVGIIIAVVVINKKKNKASANNDYPPQP